MTESNQRITDTQSIAGPIGRGLRFLLGVWFIVLVVPYFRTRGWPSILATAGLVLGLLVVYSLIHLGVSNYLPNLNRWVGAILAWIPAVLVFVFGTAQAQVAVLTFASLSLILASLRGDPGCEVMSIPGAIFKKHTHLVCIVFSPIDWLEAKIFKSGKGV